MGTRFPVISASHGVLPKAPSGGRPAKQGIPKFMSYQDDIQQVETLILSKQGTWAGISAESVIRMRVQNRFRSGLDIAR